MPSDNTETQPLEGEALQAHVTKLLSDHMQDVDKHFSDTMEQLEGLETTFTAMLDAKFQEVLARLPRPPPAHAPLPQPTRVAPPPTVLGHAQRILNPPAQTSATGTAMGTAVAGVAGATGVTQAHDAQLDDYYGEDEYEGEYADDFKVDQPPGRPRAYIRRPPPRPLVRDDDHVAKLKLHVPTFDGCYNPDAYLSWELELDQRFACLNYPEDRRVSAAPCEFTSFASIWWSEYCHANHANPITMWDALKHAMRIRFVPPYYQRSMLTKLARLDHNKNAVEDYYQEL
jgi:hypothetical protein